MRTPSRKSRYSKKILAIANSDVDEREKVWLVTDLMQQVTAENPFISKKDLAKETIKRAVAKGLGDIEAERLYRSAKQVVIPFLDSGEEKVRSDALLDALIMKAKDELYRPIFAKDGTQVGEEFDANVMNAITKAVGLKLSNITKTQQNILTAQNQSQQTKDNNDFELEDADQEQLERFIAGEIKDHPELVDKIFNKISKASPIEANFYQSDE